MDTHLASQSNRAFAATTSPAAHTLTIATVVSSEPSSLSYLIQHACKLLHRTPLAIRQMLDVSAAQATAGRMSCTSFQAVRFGVVRSFGAGIDKAVAYILLLMCCRQQLRAQNLRWGSKSSLCNCSVLSLLHCSPLQDLVQGQLVHWKTGAALCIVISRPASGGEHALRSEAFGGVQSKEE